MGLSVWYQRRILIKYNIKPIITNYKRKQCFVKEVKGTLRADDLSGAPAQSFLGSGLCCRAGVESRDSVNLLCPCRAVLHHTSDALHPGRTAS